jgi:hypothetical protein
MRRLAEEIVKMVEEVSNAQTASTVDAGSIEQTSQRLQRIEMEAGNLRSLARGKN